MAFVTGFIKHSVMIPVMLAVLSLLGGCTQTSQSDNDNTQINRFEASHVETIVLGKRRFDIALPHGYQKDREYKLLLAFHGSGSSSRQMRLLSDFSRYSNEYIVAYPKAKVGEWNEGCDCNKAHRLKVDDLAFVDAMIANINTHYPIAPGEIYAAGFSQGGLFVQNLLCKRSQTFKAIATVAAPMSLPLAQQCKIEQPTSYMMVHGTSDRTLPFQGLAHKRFALIGAEQAIELLAELNGSLQKPLKKTQGRTELTAYWNGQQKTHLYAVDKGIHNWSHDGFDTTKTIVDFFASSNTPELPEHSKWVDVADTKLHIRAMGEKQNNQPTVVMLSGPNANFHADSAWFALLQNQLAEQYRVLVVDRPGNGWSEFKQSTGYVEFAAQLHQSLKALGETNVVFVGFASSNITLVEYERRFGRLNDVKVAGMLWIDPDVLTPFGIEFYREYPVTFYREKLAPLLPHLAKGAWTERTAKKLAVEREKIQGLIPQLREKHMDWQYFDLASQQRLLIDRQQTRAIEIARYHDDLEAMKNFSFITSTKVSVIDSDFEQGQISAAPEAKEKLTRWMNETTQWSKQVAEHSGGQYIALNNAEHLVPFEHPDVIAKALKQLLEN